jgi:hypothetical protein
MRILSAAVEEVICTVTDLVTEGDRERATSVLLRARETARADAAGEDEWMITAMLARHLAEGGDLEGSLSEHVNAERIAAANGDAAAETTSRTTTAFHLLKMGRRDAAAEMMRDVLANPDTSLFDRHFCLTALGDMIAETEPAVAHQYLDEAFRAAIESQLPPAYWDQTLASRLATAADDLAVAYLRQLRDTARAANDSMTERDVDAILQSLVRA